MSGTAGHVTWTCYHSGNLLLLCLCISSPSSVDSLYLHEERGFAEEALREVTPSETKPQEPVFAVCLWWQRNAVNTRQVPRDHPLRDAQGQEMAHPPAEGTRTKQWFHCFLSPKWLSPYEACILWSAEQEKISLQPHRIVSLGCFAEVVGLIHTSCSDLPSHWDPPAFGGCKLLSAVEPLLRSVVFPISQESHSFFGDKSDSLWETEELLIFSVVLVFFHWINSF